MSPYGKMFPLKFVGINEVCISFHAKTVCTVSFYWKTVVPVNNIHFRQPLPNLIEMW
jgi:hypothetical protein